MKPPQELLALTELTSIGSTDFIPVGSATGGAGGGPGWRGRIAGTNVGSGSGTSSLASVQATGAIWFNGEDNAAYARACSHAVPGGAIGQNDFTVAMDFQCPTYDTIRTNGHGLFVLSESDPSSTLNSSIQGWIRGTNGTGIGGSAVGDLVIRVQTSSGGDLVLVVSGFAQSYGGTVPRLRVSREVTATDWVMRVFCNATLIGTYANGTGSDWGTSLGAGAFWFSYGFASRSGLACPFRGYIAKAAVVPGAITSAASCATFDREFPNPLDINHAALILFAQLVPSASETMSNATTATWANLSKAGDSFTESGGGAIIVPSGDASSWFSGRVNSTAYPSKLLLTASAASSTNRCTLPSVAAIRRRYLVKVTARQVSGTPADLIIGFDLNNRATTSQNLRFTPTSSASTFTAVLSSLNSATLLIGLADDSASAGQVYEIDTVQLYNQGAAVFADFSVGDGYIVRSLGTPASDVTIGTGGNHDWVPRKRFAEHVIALTVDQSVTSSTTPEDTGLTFRMQANAAYAFDIRGTFSLAGTASGYKFQLTGPSSPTHFRAVGYVGNSAGNNNVEIQVDTATATLMNGSLANAVRHEMRYTGAITNGANEGSLTLQMSQQVSDASAITIERGSRMTLTRIS